MHRVLALVAVALMISACTKSSSDTKEEKPGTKYMTDCGVVVGDKLKNPVTSSDGFEVTVDSVEGSNVLKVTPKDTEKAEQMLIKLHGIGPNAADSDAAIAKLRSLSRSRKVFIPAGADCTVTVPGGGKALVGSLVSSSGSVSEDYVKSGLGKIDSADVCNVKDLATCFAALDIDRPDNAGALEAFLWKPESDRDGLLAIHTTPGDTKVVVDGETGANFGPGNGFGNLARFLKIGCEYEKPKIQVFDAAGVPYTVGGKTTFTVPDPCEQSCLVSDKVIACPER